MGWSGDGSTSFFDIKGVLDRYQVANNLAQINSKEEALFARRQRRHRRRPVQLRPHLPPRRSAVQSGREILPGRGRPLQHHQGIHEGQEILHRLRSDPLGLDQQRAPLRRRHQHDRPQPVLSVR